MRVSGNKLKHVLDFFHAELKEIYPFEEIEELFALAAEHYLGFSKKDLLLKKEENINQSDLIKIYDCGKELKKQIPIQYILAEAHFYNLKFKVNANVLIPRPETEELVDLILKENTAITSLLDIGTGSGCIPISIKKNRKQASVFACDISLPALDLAKHNAKKNETEINFFEANALKKDSIKNHLKEKIEVIVSNPPYIKKTEKSQMDKNVLAHEPHLALFVEDEDAIIFYKRIIDFCRDGLKEGGKLYFELNPLTADNVVHYALHSNQFKSCSVINDMSGKQRFLRAIKNQSFD